MPEVRNWVAQLTDTEGTVSNISLSGLFTDSASFAQAFNGQSAIVYYSIKNGDNREVGIGNFNGSNTLERTTVTATLVGGVYDDTVPSRINLVGQSTVKVTLNSSIFNDLVTHLGRTDNPHGTTATQVGADPIGSAATVQGNLDTHVADNLNPHSVTAGQVGADPAGSSATVQSNLDTHIADNLNPHSVTAAQTGADPVGSASAVQTDLNTHKANVSNPHATTAAQVGADPAGSAGAVQLNLDSHEADFGNPHNVTAVQAGADPSGSAATVQGNLDTHVADNANPHSVTVSQIGAEPDLGNPTVNGQVLSSDTLGNRSWVDQTGGGGSLDDLANVGTGEGNIYRDTIGGVANIKTLKAGSGMTITDLADEVQLDATGVGGGEANTSSNAGTGGVGIVLPKSGVNLPFKSINITDARLIVTDDIANNEIDLGVNESQFNHMQDTANPHATTAVQVGADPVGSAATVQGNLDLHVADLGNPHSVTPAQIGAVEEALLDNKKYSRQNAAWVESPRTPIGGLYGRFTFSSDTTATDPGPGGVKVNNADLTLATELYVSGTTRFGAAVDPDFLTWGPQDFLGLFDELQGNGAFYSIIGSVVDNTGWYTIPISATGGSDSTIDDTRNAVLTEITAPGSRVPRGGTIGQAVTKTGPTDFETGWSSFDPAGSASGVQFNLDNHISDNANPHGVTAAQAGADPAGSASAVQANLDVHTSDTVIHMDTDQGAAMDAANNPNASNAIATIEDLFNNPSGGTALQYKWSTNTAATDPGAGIIKANNADLSLATELYVSNITQAGNNVQPAWNAWREGDYVGVSDKKNSNNGWPYRLTANSIDNTGWFTLPVSALGSTSNPAIGNNRDVVVNLIADPNSRLPQGGTAGQALTKIDNADYNTEWKTLSASVTLPVKVKTGTIVVEGSGVAAVGWDATSGRVLVQGSDAISLVGMPVIGFALATYAADEEFDLPIYGEFDYNTSAWAENDRLYQANLGAVVTSPPNNDGVPNQEIAKVLVSSVTGKLFVNPDNHGIYIDWAALGISNPVDDNYGYLRIGGGTPAWVRGSRVFEAATNPGGQSVGDFTFITS